MTALRPFFLLTGRASVFWLGMIQLFAVSMIFLGLAQPDERLGLYLDAVLFAAIAFPACAGWLAGAVVQEFQHTSFAMALPGVRSRIAAGFLATGLVLTAVVVCWIALASSSPQNLPMLFCVSLGAYCLGGVLIDPLSSWITGVNVTVMIFILISSRRIARVAADHPWIIVAISLGVGVACMFRLFARSTFRLKPFRLTSPLPGSFALEKGRKTTQQRRRWENRKGTEWRAGYLGSDTWPWVRAAIHEVYGPRGWKSWVGTFGRAWGLGALILLYAWFDKGDMSYGVAVARSLNDALFHSPHLPPFGERGGPYPVVAIALAAAGVVTALFSSVTLNDVIAYPLSRKKRADVQFAGGLVDGAIFLFIVAPCLYGIGQLSGWLAGFEPRFDFIPFFFRPLMITLILMPLAYAGRLGLRAATRRKSEHTMVGVIFAVIAFVVAVGIVTYVLMAMSIPPAVELAGLVVALIVSQGIYRVGLIRYYRAADLA